MAVILENILFAENTYRMVVNMSDKPDLGTCGQFYMLRTSEMSDPLLARPISIYDTDEEKRTVTFIYVVVGRGTELMSKMHVGDDIALFGPLGKAFPLLDEDITLIGGGIGAAPLYLLAKKHKELFPKRHITMNIGFSNEKSVALVDEFKSLCDDVILNVGGYVTDDVDFTKNRIFYACGTEPMMEAACRLAFNNKKKLYISLDKHMACGVGACLVCTCKTKDGTKKRACKDGPVFDAEEVFDVERGRFYE